MNKPRIEEVITLVRNLKDEVKYYSNPKKPITYHSEVDPVSSWKAQDIESVVDGVTLPPDLQRLWELSSGLRLFNDITSGQWGLKLWSAQEVAERQTKEFLHREDDFREGDLVIGEFLGDSDRLLVRCNAREQDFGSVMILLPIYEREEWYQVSSSLAEFLQIYLDRHGEKYWETED